MNCPSCRKTLQEDFKFCPYCGTQIINNCPSCGKKVEPSWLACPYCGTALKAKTGVNPNITVQPPQPPPQYYPQDPHLPHFAHGRYYSSSYRKRRKKGFLGRIFSS
ncbi:MAG: zinc ribbon domain-containing protein [Firmicutes bacterium]|nr:zinc ribbon domain-containing protein [Bacillota bacterium]